MSQVRRPKRDVDGVLLLDKPLGVSSNGALQKARWLFTAAKAGHTGVLDPLATGLLPVCFGEATKFSSFLLDADKRYTATVAFGRVTTTGDVEGEVVSERPVDVSRSALEAALDRFTGPIRQVPPMYSALKFQGKALYEYARQGIEIERKARDVIIHGIDLLSFDGKEAVIDVRCSKGTYIRTLGEDIGEMLGCGAHLSGLRRTATAGFEIGSAVTLEALEGRDVPERDALLLPPDVLVRHLPEVSLGESECFRFCRGQAVRFSLNCAIMTRFRVYREVDRKFLGLAEWRGDSSLQPVRLLAAQAVS
ncbi:tRNA pseudouridine(55) synthase TruB [Paludibacterium paludis]|uniref:tRNA pseudouridine synthase B n=1 Tax=Paludibacterium paludis TaxID=1225769 RepID=A0A918P3T4_9NEIS|nr:tRNA pseudouridine(55) synthase TruB [Paludibacterium paludis]GGY18955.1 tRNA pseudouridine synthase B [Paludibacterium paludis]